MPVTKKTRFKSLIKRRPVTKRRRKLPVNEKMVASRLSDADLLKLADRYPVPRSFWDGDDDPSQPDPE